MSSGVETGWAPDYRGSAFAFRRIGAALCCPGDDARDQMRRPVEEKGTRNSFSSLWKHLAGNVLVLDASFSSDPPEIGPRVSCHVFVAEAGSSTSLSLRQRRLLFLQSHGPDRLGQANRRCQAHPLVGDRSAREQVLVAIFRRYLGCF